MAMVAVALGGSVPRGRTREVGNRTPRDRGVWRVFHDQHNTQHTHTQPKQSENARPAGVVVVMDCKRCVCMYTRLGLHSLHSHAHAYSQSHQRTTIAHSHMVTHLQFASNFQLYVLTCINHVQVLQRTHTMRGTEHT